MGDVGDELVLGHVDPKSDGEGSRTPLDSTKQNILQSVPLDKTVKLGLEKISVGEILREANRRYVLIRVECSSGADVNALLGPVLVLELTRWPT